jgi:hypothetical protein
MRPKTLIAMAVAATFAISTGALAGGKQHRSVEVQTPASVSEAGTSMSESMGVGATSAMGATGTIGHDSALISGETADYWRMDAEPSDVGSTSAAGASGSVGFDSSFGSSPD